MTPAYLAKLACGNIGVALGKVSNNLIAVDIDDDKLVRPFITANPFLKGTLQTRGARGRVFWLQMEGRYPGKTHMLKTSSGEDCGEFRSNGGQSIIHGTHPAGHPYTVVNGAKVRLVDFADIVWPPEIANPPSLKPELPELNGVSPTEETEDPEEPEETKDTQESEEVSQWLFSVHSVEDVLRFSTPTSVHQNYRCALILARGVKALEIQAGKKFTPTEHSEIHARWLKLAAIYLRQGQSAEVYFMEYVDAYRLAKFPLGSIVIRKALEAARENPLPDSALPWTKDPDVRLVAALCRELQMQSKKEPFFSPAEPSKRSSGISTMPRAHLGWGHFASWVFWNWLRRARD